MKKVMFISVAFAVMCLFILSTASDLYAAGTAAEAKVMMEKATAFLKADGKEKAFSAFDNPQGQFVKDDLYIFVIDVTGMTLAHGGNPKLVGKSLIGLKDSDGKPFIKGLIDAANAKGTGWFDYNWTNPTTKKVQAKSTYFQKVGDLVFGCGIYK
ncbi:MAG: histidine kinase [Syntrophus sp. (in: bacteria)]|nr:histidine kinase [Syntrophus sp. (in: bacteria)]